MAKSKSGDISPSADHPRRSLLVELKGEKTAEDGSTTTFSTEIFAVLSMEEVIAYMRNRQQSVEIMELKVLGQVQILSSSEHLALRSDSFACGVLSGHRVESFSTFCASNKPYASPQALPAPEGWLWNIP